MIGQVAQQCRTDATHAKGKPEKQTGNQAHFPGYQFLSVNQYGGKG